MAESKSIVLEHLLAIQADITVMKVDISDIKQRVSASHPGKSLRLWSFLVRRALISAIGALASLSYELLHQGIEP
jgi:hypothetical protein